MKLGCSLLVFLFLGSCAHHPEKEKEDHSGNHKNYSSYIGKTIQEFILSECDTAQLSFYIVDEPPMKASSLVMNLNDSVSVEFFVNKFKYMNNFDTNRVWNIKEFKKETISVIKLFKNDMIVGEWR